MSSMALMEQVAMYFVALPCPPMPILAASDEVPKAMCFGHM